MAETRRLTNRTCDVGPVLVDWTTCDVYHCQKFDSHAGPVVPSYGYSGRHAIGRSCSQYWFCNVLKHQRPFVRSTSDKSPRTNVRNKDRHSQSRNRLLDRFVPTSYYCTLFPDIVHDGCQKGDQTAFVRVMWETRSRYFGTIADALMYEPDQQSSARRREGALFSVLANPSVLFSSVSRNCKAELNQVSITSLMKQGSAKSDCRQRPKRRLGLSISRPDSVLKPKPDCLHVSKTRFLRT